jgi:hypothetical protein
MADPLTFQSQSKRIGDTTYYVTPLGFVQARQALVKLTNLIGPALRELSSAELGNLKGELSALGGLLSGLADKDLVYFQDLFAPKTEIELDYEPSKRPYLHKPLPTGGSRIESHFAPTGPRFGDYFEWLVFCIQVNYAPFFKGIWAKVAASKVLGKQATESSSNSPTESNGPSGD